MGLLGTTDHLRSQCLSERNNRWDAIRSNPWTSAANPGRLASRRTQTRSLHRSFDSNVTEIKSRIKAVFKSIQENTERRIRRFKIDYDRRVRGGSFEVGDKVYLLRVIWNQGMFHKFQRYGIGSYNVIGKIGPVNYVIEVKKKHKSYMPIYSRRLMTASSSLRMVSLSN